MMMPMMDCDAVLRKLWDYLDRELTEDRMHEIEMHLEQCEKCRPQADFRRAFRSAVTGARDAAGDTAALTERVRRALHDAARQ